MFDAPIKLVLDMEVSVSLCTFIQCNSALFTIFRSVRDISTYRSPLYVHDVIKVIASVLISIERKICGEKHVPTQLNILMNVGYHQGTCKTLHSFRNKS